MFQGKPQVLFLLGGFTEHGTYAAGDFLATRWYDLWRRYSKEQPADNQGDFLLIIYGKSPYNPSLLWKPVPNLEDITRFNIKKHEHIDWSRDTLAPERTEAPELEHF